MKNLFPYFKNNNQNIYLDSAASTQILDKSLEKINNIYLNHYSNIHRGLCDNAEYTTLQYEESRVNIANFIGANYKEIIFTKGTTEGINLLANHYKNVLNPGDIILLTKMEHHSNILPWIELVKYGIEIKYIDVNSNGILDLEDFKLKYNNKVKLISICYISNVTGIINPIDYIINSINHENTDVIIDAAQAISNIEIDVKKIKCDYLVFSAHKSYGPNGVGILYASKDKIEKLSLYQTGGDTVDNVSFNNINYLEAPYRFEAGTPNITGIIAFNESINFLKNNKIDYNYINKLENYLIDNEFNIIGIGFKRAPIISISTEKYNINDLAYYLSIKNVCFRFGTHCATPFVKEVLKLNGTIRFSFGAYNDIDDIDKLIDIINKFKEKKNG